MYNLTTDRVEFFLKQQDFKFRVIDLKLEMRTSSPSKIMGGVEVNFENIYKRGMWYRATGVVLKNLGESVLQNDLFGKHVQEEKLLNIFSCVDELSRKFGKHTVRIGSSIRLGKIKQTINVKKEDVLLKRGFGKKFNSIPIIGIVK